MSNSQSFDNQNIQAARAYHEATKLSYINLHNKPPLYKSYANLPVIPLPTDFSPPEAPTLAAVASVQQQRIPPCSLTALARLLFFSDGLIRKGVFPEAGEVHFRAAASAGALYPVEAYLVCGEIPSIPPLPKGGWGDLGEGLGMRATAPLKGILPKREREGNREWPVI